VHASLGGSSFNIIGPTGALSGILSANAVRYGPEILPFLSILSGCQSIDRLMCFPFYFLYLIYLMFKILMLVFACISFSFIAHTVTLSASSHYCVLAAH
jgi:hypothetical protein